MAANRKVGGLAIATALGVLVLLLLFGGGVREVFRPERSPEESLSGDAGSIPGVVGNETEPAAEPALKADAPAGKAAPKKAAEIRRIPLEIAVIDGETGEPLIGAQPRLHADRETSHILSPCGGVFTHPEATCKVGMTAHVRATIDLPDGYAQEKTGPQFVQGTVSIYAERVRVTFPAWRHAVVMVRVMDFEGYPVSGALVTSVTFMGRRRKVTSSPTDRDGYTRVHGIPAVHGEVVSATAYTDLRHSSASGRVMDSWTPARVRIVLPKKPNNHQLGIGGGAGGSFGGRGGHRTLRMPGRESIAVTVRHRDGRPAANTMVVARGSGNYRFRRTDATGRVVLNGLNPGKIDVQVTEPGFVTGMAVSVTVVEGTQATLTIVEAPPRFVTGIVLDEWGHALPSASLVLTSGFRGRLVCLDRGLQHLNLLTGPDGRFAFPNVPPGSVTIDARYGTRSRRAKVAEVGITTVKFGKP